jgi:hypothetical protein
LGRVEDKKEDGKFVVKFLRSYIGRDDKFIWPNKDNIDTNIEVNAIERVLPDPIENKNGGRFKFPQSVNLKCTKT